ncbi:MAG: phenylalanine--tRNA ligase subunit beta [Desulfovibrio sp.]|jgi:phenylalanyl-tRNA synthetase beta chain|nr:phenylalanine--tRNA ligase subunit beta [Desulfovibrio sp.]
MLLSLSWLREFVPYEGTAAELGQALTMIGLEMDGLFRPYERLRPIVVGHVLECARHPEADNLSVCRVDVGDDVLDIVCGAPNVGTGQKVAVVKVGVALPTGGIVKKAKLRGVPSNGMLCSEYELGLSDEHDGILLLEGTLPVGASLPDALALDDEVLDIAVTPNRGDCLSVLGLAREVAAMTGLPLTMPALRMVESGPDCSKDIRLEIADPNLCSLYHGRIIEGASTRKSPARLRYRLNAVGLRAVSNLVDVTNYILMELGQPLHAFDLDEVRGGSIIVRGAEQGETLVTLDGQRRALLPSDITIRDAERVIGLGGVMGGLNSEITEKSSRVFLECAVFNPLAIRKTARRLSLHSEAAYRFERGVDQTGAGYALERAAAMMAEFSGGYVRTGLPKVEPLPWTSPTVRLRRRRAESLLGITLEKGFYEETLSRLYCKVREVALPADAEQTGSDQEWDVVPPGYRRDLTREADLIEEVARLYGVDRVPPSLPKVSRLLERVGEPESRHVFLGRIKRWAQGAGLHEVINYSFVSHRELDHLAGEDGARTNERISIMNPLNDDMNVLRTDLAPGLLRSLSNNLTQGANSVGLFEVATVFASELASETTVREVPRLGILLYGARFEQAWPQSAGDMDYLDLKGLLEHLFSSFTLPEADFILADNVGPSVKKCFPAWLSPCVRVDVRGDCVGWAGRVRPTAAESYHAKKAVWMAELDLDRVLSLRRDGAGGFVRLPVFPPVRRDMTCIAGPTITAGMIVEEIRKLRSPLLVSSHLIDYFEPDGREERNLTFRLIFRHAERTLRDEEVDKQRDAIAASLQKSLPVQI